MPVLKIGVLGLLAWTSRHAPAWRRLERAKLYRLIEAVGHWSMLDVYVVVLLAATVRFGPLAGVQAGPGLLAFAAVVVLTMFATYAFDPKLIWGDPRRPPARRPRPPRRLRMPDDEPDPAQPPAAPGAAAPEPPRPAPAGAEELPQPRIVEARRWNVSLVWLVPGGGGRDRRLDAGAQRLSHRSARSRSSSSPPTASRPARPRSATRRS